jgi:hypothetical protein
MVTGVPQMEKSEAALLAATLSRRRDPSVTRAQGRAMGGSPQNMSESFDLIELPLPSMRRVSRG